MDPAPYILFLGGEPRRRTQVAELLGRQYDVGGVDDLRPGRRADLVMLDLVPDPSIDQPWPKLKLPTAGEGAPILALVRLDRDEEVRRALDAGAADVAD